MQWKCKGLFSLYLLFGLVEGSHLASYSPRPVFLRLSYRTPTCFLQTKHFPNYPHDPSATLIDSLRANGFGYPFDSRPVRRFLMNGLLRTSFLVSALIGLPSLTLAEDIGQERFNACYQQCTDTGARRIEMNAAAPKALQELSSQCLASCESLRAPAATMEQEFRSRAKLNVGVVSLQKYRER